MIVIGSNLVGAGAVMAFMKILLPLPQISHAVGLGYLLLALIVGGLSSLLLLRPVLAWLHDPEHHDRNMIRRLVLRIPASQAVLCAVLWAIGALVLTLASLGGTVPHQATVMLLTTLIAGTMAVLMTFLLATELTRTVAAEALGNRGVTSALSPSLRTRMFAAWLMTTGAPVFGIALLCWAGSTNFFPDGNPVTASLILASLTLITGLISTILLIRQLVDPIDELKTAIGAVRRGKTDVQVPIYDGAELGVLQAGFNEMLAGIKQQRRIRSLFGNYVGDEVARRALEESPTLGGEDRKVAVLFVDVIGSTTFAVNHTPEEVVAELNQFFEHVVKVVHQHKGVINKFQGDAALAIFGAPLPLLDATGHALAAARQMQQELANSALTCGIGVSSGHVVAGHIGGRDRFEYTVIGDAVNQAARLTELAKDTPGRVLTSAATLRDANEAEQHRWTLLKTVELRGREAMTQLARPLRPTLAERA